MYYHDDWYDDDNLERQPGVTNMNYVAPTLPVPPPVNAPYCVWKKYWKKYWIFYNWWRANQYYR